MRSSDFAFVAMAVNPFGGLLIAIPFAILKLHYPIWRAVLAGAPLGYLQVFAVDSAWSLLERVPLWRRLMVKERGPWARRLIESRGGFWITFAASPVLGPWLVMALMRWMRVPQRRVALPIALSLACFAALLSWVCARAPQLLAR